MEGRGLSPGGAYRPVAGAVAAPPVGFGAPLPAPTVPLAPVLAVAPVFWPGAAARASMSSSTLPDAPPCIWVVPFAPPRICVSDEAPCASTGPASRAEIATAIAEVFTSFIQFSKVLLTTNRSVSSRHRSQPEHAHRRINRYPRTARPLCKP